MFWPWGWVNPIRRSTCLWNFTGWGILLFTPCWGPAWCFFIFNQFLLGSKLFLLSLFLTMWTTVIWSSFWFRLMNFESNFSVFTFEALRFFKNRMRFSNSWWVRSILDVASFLTMHTSLRKHSVWEPFNRVSPLNFIGWCHSFTIFWWSFVHCYSKIMRFDILLFDSLHNRFPFVQNFDLRILHNIKVRNSIVVLLKHARKISNCDWFQRNTKYLYSLLLELL